MLNLLSRLPLSLLYRCSGMICFVVFRLLRYRRSVVRENLNASFSDMAELELDLIESAFYRQTADVLVEVIAAARMQPQHLLERVEFENPEVVESLKARQQPFILLAAHHCNWEWLLLAMCLKFSMPIDAVYKPLSQISVDKFMQKVRTRFGAEPIPKTNALIEIMRRRGAMRVFAMVADQAPVPTRETRWLSFMGRDAAFQVGVQKIAQATRYPVLFVGMKRLDRGRYRVKFESLGSPPYSKEGYALVDQYAQLVEAQIRSAPSDWLWTNRRWKHKRPLYD